VVVRRKPAANVRRKPAANDERNAVFILEEIQRSQGPPRIKQDRPRAHWVSAAWDSSPSLLVVDDGLGIDFLLAPRIRAHGARNAAHVNTRTGS
jgi:hypothetical protein